ncbi:MAG: hypothetical protein JWO36_6574 [Myxococcales bacterium]|nr:hypothetical protein [Myxococcales bacterium]
MNRRNQRGSAMLVTMILVAALFAGGAVLVSMQLGATRSTDVTRNGLSALYCAEAGLAAARPVVANNYANWSGSLGTATEPSWLSGINHDIDGDGSADFVITLKDNDDELPPLTNDLTHDNDLKIYIVSTCIKYPETPKEVRELVQFNLNATCYQSQEGGCGGNGNSN